MLFSVSQTATVSTFEEIALKFVTVGEQVSSSIIVSLLFIFDSLRASFNFYYSSSLVLRPFSLLDVETYFGLYQDALRTYLLRKLDFLGKEDRSQITMIATWAAELYLDKVHISELEYT